MCSFGGIVWNFALEQITCTFQKKLLEDAGGKERYEAKR